MTLIDRDGRQVWPLPETLPEPRYVVKVVLAGRHPLTSWDGGETTDRATAAAMAAAWATRGGMLGHEYIKADQVARVFIETDYSRWKA